MNFEGFAAPLSPACMEYVSGLLEVDMPSIWAVLDVETAGCGYLPDRRLQILFERHKFDQFTNRIWRGSAPDLSNPEAGGYGERGAGQYPRLLRAMALDETAALKCTSWGLGQVMGFNAASAGFDDVRKMIAAFADSEDQQLTSMAAFIQRNGLDAPLRQRDWAAFAAGYNGAAYWKHGYDQKLAMRHARYEVGPLPDLMVRAVQLALVLIGIPDVGGVDGWYGQGTQKALLAFQARESLTPTGRPDDETVACLMQRAGWQ